MKQFVTEISLEDFLKLYPDILDDYYLMEGAEEDFPLAVGIHNDYPDGGYIGKYLGWNVQFIADKVKHIYSTRDYFEVERLNEPWFRYKLPKRETKSIYLIR